MRSQFKTCRERRALMRKDPWKRSVWAPTWQLPSLCPLFFPFFLIIFPFSSPCAPLRSPKTQKIVEITDQCQGGAQKRPQRKPCASISLVPLVAPASSSISFGAGNGSFPKPPPMLTIIFLARLASLCRGPLV